MLESNTFSRRTWKGIYFHLFCRTKQGISSSVIHLSSDRLVSGNYITWTERKVPVQYPSPHTSPNSPKILEKLQIISHHCRGSSASFKSSAQTLVSVCLCSQSFRPSFRSLSVYYVLTLSFFSLYRPSFTILPFVLFRFCFFFFGGREQNRVCRVFELDKWRTIDGSEDNSWEVRWKSDGRGRGGENISPSRWIICG